MSELFPSLSPIDAEFAEGYLDGRNLDTPPPSSNRTEAYRHSWEVGRMEKLDKPIPYELSMANAERIIRGWVA